MAKLIVPGKARLWVTTDSGNSARLYIPASEDNRGELLLSKKGGFQSYTPDIDYDATNHDIYLTSASYDALKALIGDELFNEMDVGVALAKHHRSNKPQSGTTKYLEKTRQVSPTNKNGIKKIKGICVMWDHTQVYAYGSIADREEYYHIKNDQQDVRGATQYQQEHRKFVKLSISTERTDLGYKIIGSSDLIDNIYPLSDASKDASHSYYYFGLIFRIKIKDNLNNITEAQTQASNKTIRSHVEKSGARKVLYTKLHDNAKDTEYPEGYEPVENKSNYYGRSTANFDKDRITR